MKNLNALAAIAALFTFLALTTGAEAAGYGCFRATNDLNIRDRPYSSATVIGTAAKGDVLEKRKRWCTLRGYWCAVTTKNGLEGYADVAFMDKMPCP